MEEKKLSLEMLTKKGKGLLIAGIVILVMGIISTVSSYFYYNNEKKNAEEFSPFQQEQYGKIEVSYILDYFAESESTGERVYLVFDEENKMYLASINDETMESLKDLLDYTYDEEKEYPGSVTIKGTSEQITPSLKELAIEYYNDVFKNNSSGFKLTKSNFSTYAGNYYLDTNRDPVTDNMSIVYMVAGVFAIFGICFVIAFFNNKRSSNKSLAKYEGSLDKINQELNGSSAVSYEKFKVYITNNYIITYSSGLQIIEHKDIVWLYPADRSYRGSVTRTIYVVTKDSKMHTVCVSAVDKKRKIVLDEIYESILAKLPKKALAGYTDENRSKVKELYEK